jgi:hypothetical protein
MSPPKTAILLVILWYPAAVDAGGTDLNMFTAMVGTIIKIYKVLLIYLDRAIGWTMMMCPIALGLKTVPRSRTRSFATSEEQAIAEGLLRPQRQTDLAELADRERRKGGSLTDADCVRDVECRLTPSGCRSCTGHHKGLCVRHGGFLRRRRQGQRGRAGHDPRDKHGKSAPGSDGSPQPQKNAPQKRERGPLRELGFLVVPSVRPSFRQCAPQLGRSRSERPTRGSS